MPAVECCITDALLRRRAGVKPPAEVRVAIIGNVDCGKSTMVGVLTRAVLDDGRGSARSKVGGKLPLATICVILPLVTLFPVRYSLRDPRVESSHGEGTNVRSIEFFSCFSVPSREGHGPQDAHVWSYAPLAGLFIFLSWQQLSNLASNYNFLGSSGLVWPLAQLHTYQHE